MLIIILGLYLFFSTVFKWFMPFILAYIIANLAEPIVCFLEKKIKFLDIQNNIIKAMESHNPISHPTLDEIIAIDGQIREKVLLGWS